MDVDSMEINFFDGNFMDIDVHQLALNPGK